MLADIALPDNNEEEFIKIASKLGIKKLYFLYDFNFYNENNVEKKLESLNVATATAIALHERYR